MLASAWLAAHPGAEGVSPGGQGLSQLGLWFGLLGSVVWASRRKGSGALAEDFGCRARLADVPVGLVAGLLSHQALLPLVALLMRPLVGDPDVSGPATDLVESAQGFGLVVLVLSVTVGAPVVEELFFRGLVLGALARRLGAVAAVAISSALFGLAHPQDLPVGALALVMVSLAAFGAVLAALAVRTGRLGSAIIAHATFNALTVFFILK